MDYKNHWRSKTTDELIDARTEARSGSEKDYETSDEIRDVLIERGLIINDHKGYSNYIQPIKINN